MPNPVTINMSLIEMFQFAIAAVIVISGIFAVIYSIWGGFLLITSGGNEEKVKPAINNIRHAFIGLIVLLLIVFSAPKVLEIAGLPFADDLRPSVIFSKMGEISRYIFGGGRTSDNEFQDPSTSNGLPSDFSDL